MTTRRIYNEEPANGIGYGAYKDTGCGQKGWPTFCQECPFPYCRWDTGEGGGLPLLKQTHEELVWKAWGDGLEIPEIVTRTGLSRRTVYRILREE